MKILGRHLSRSEEQHQKAGPLYGVPMLGLGGLSSSAYDLEAAATVLIPLGELGIAFVLPITVATATLQAVAYLSYPQTIAAYPNGGGYYSVAKENLGTFAEHGRRFVFSYGIVRRIAVVIPDLVTVPRYLRP